MLNDFSDKVRWRMRHDRNPLFVTLQDRYALRGYAEERGVPTVPILAKATSFDELPMDDLPRTCMLKATHGSGMNLLRWEGHWYRFGDGQGLVEQDEKSFSCDRMRSRRISEEVVADVADGWLQRVYNPEEWAYTQIPPRLVVEPFVKRADGGLVRDIRCYVFDGKVRAESVGSAFYRRRNLNVFFDRDWQVLPSSSDCRYLPDQVPERPFWFDDIVRYAEFIGAGVDFVRVDFFESSEGPLLGEVALYPHAGWLGSPSNCPQQNAWLGAQWVGSQWDGGGWPGRRRAMIKSRIHQGKNRVHNVLRRVAALVRGR